MQELATLECTHCRNRNYASTKNKKQNPDKLSLMKYCKFCRKHIAHKEIK